jgi:glycosyltransferase involved in cell wall biosynthesis
VTAGPAERPRAPVTAIVLTFNEERNLADCLASLSGWTTAVFVVDSGSTDGTLAIAAAHGAAVRTHTFETHAAQWQWALATLPLETDWVLGLDADQRVTPELREAIVSALSAGGAQADGWFVRRRQVFRGRWIRHGGYYPKYLLKLFRHTQVTLDPSELVDHHFHVQGTVRQLHADIVEDNRNEAEIAVWTAKHNRYARLQARQELAALGVRPVGLTALFGSPDARTRWLKQAWARLPLFVRPCLYVTYRYVLRLGFLDGKQGFIFHVLQAFWYRLLVDINIDELRSTPVPDVGRDRVAVLK